MNDPSKIIKRIPDAFGLLCMKDDYVWYYNRRSLVKAKWDDIEEPNSLSYRDENLTKHLTYELGTSEDIGEQKIIDSNRIPLSNRLESAFLGQKNYFNKAKSV